MSSNTIKFLIVAVILFIVIKSCSSDNSGSGWEKSPVDKLVTTYSDKSDYSIILADMDADGSGSSTVYKHKYQVLIPEEDTVLMKETGWETVSDVFFNQHINDLGMEIVYKKDGKLHKETAPAGYSNYVGNEKYGRWQQSGGSSFWQFYGQYAFMSSMLNMGNPIRRSYYDDYRGGYYGTGRSYYGGNGAPRYGTQTYGNSGRKTTWGSKPSTFKNDVRSRVSRSAASTRRARSASRSSTSSSYRSRSGGAGK